MADLTEIQASSATRLVGDDEANAAAIDSSKRLAVLATPARVSLTWSAPGSVSVGTSSGTLLAANASRKGLIITNVSSRTISFAVGAPAVLGAGVTLYPGGVWVMDESTFTTAQINAIASAAASTVAHQELTL